MLDTFIIFGAAGISLGIPIDQRFKGSMLGTAFAQIYFLIPKKNLGVDHPPTDWTETAGKFVEDVIGIYRLGFNLGSCLRTR